MTRRPRSRLGRAPMPQVLFALACLLLIRAASAAPPSGRATGSAGPDAPSCHPLQGPADGLLVELRTDDDAALEVHTPDEPVRRYRPPVQESLPAKLLLSLPPGPSSFCVTSAFELSTESFYELAWAPADATAARRTGLLAQTRAAAAAAGTEPSDWERAVVAYQEAAAAWADADAPFESALAALRAGQALGWLSRPHDAETTLTGALDRLAESPDEYGVRRLGATLRLARGLTRISLGRNAEARSDFEAARADFRAIGDRGQEAECINGIGLSEHYDGRLDEALARYREALAIPVTPPDFERRARIANNIGGIHYTRGDADEALAAFDESYEAHLAIDNVAGQMDVAMNRASLYRRIGEYDSALGEYEAARRIAQANHNLPTEARTLGGIGRTYLALGREDRAQVYLRRSLRLRRRVADEKGEAATLTALGQVYLRTGELDGAADAFGNALRIRRRLGDQPRTTEPLLGLAEVARRRDDYAVAGAYASEAADVAQGMERRRDEAEARYVLGRIRTESGATTAARDELGEALALATRARAPTVITASSVALARLDRAAGDLDGAQVRLDTALAEIESLRSRIAVPALRATYAGIQEAAYDLQTDVFVARFHEDPTGPWLKLALQTVERHRARVVLELLRERRSDLPSSEDSAVRERRRALRRKARALAAGLSARAAPDPAAEASLADVLVKLDTLEADLRRADSRYAQLMNPPQDVLENLQRRLGPNEAVLEYELGAERSYLFAIDRARVAVFELPPARVIGEAVRAYYDAVRQLDASGFRPERAQARALTELLLAPARDFLDAESLAVVPDGALHYLPFGALPLPDDGPPLIRDHSVVAPLSAALLVQHPGRTPRATELRIGIVADPVFSPNDPRLGEAARLTRVSADPRPPTDSNPLERLPATGREADAIAALFPPERRLVATGTDASRALVSGGGLAAYDVLHFATHGRFDSQYPMLSGLWLARVDAAGAPVDGFIGIHEAHDLRLSAELVVLSGCETALGRELKAEGLVGLTHGFLYAGVPRVVASLWRVPERATAALMTAFYEGLVVEGLAPARALAAAQGRVAADRRWRDPYFWAGFTLQGSW